MGFLRRTGLLVAKADDAGVRIVISQMQMGEIEKSWLDLLPDERQLLFDLKWEPVEPKHPLIQLAEALDDWTEDV